MRVRIETSKSHGGKFGLRTKVFIDDVEQKRVKSAVVNFDTESIPSVVLEFYPEELVVDAEVIPVQ